MPSHRRVEQSRTDTRWAAPAPETSSRRTARRSTRSAASRSRAGRRSTHPTWEGLGEAADRRGLLRQPRRRTSRQRTGRPPPFRRSIPRPPAPPFCGARSRRSPGSPKNWGRGGLRRETGATAGRRRGGLDVSVGVRERREHGPRTAREPGRCRGPTSRGTTPGSSPGRPTRRGGEVGQYRRPPPAGSEASGCRAGRTGRPAAGAKWDDRGPRRRRRTDAQPSRPAVAVATSRSCRAQSSWDSTSRSRPAVAAGSRQRAGLVHRPERGDRRHDRGGRPEGADRRPPPRSPCRSTTGPASPRPPVTTDAEAEQ